MEKWIPVLPSLSPHRAGEANGEERADCFSGDVTQGGPGAGELASHQPAADEAEPYGLHKLGSLRLASSSQGATAQMQIAG